MKFPVASRRELNLYRLKKRGIMKLNLFILVFALGFLTACNIKEISDLQDQVQDLERQLEEVTDPETMTKLQKEFIEKQMALVQENEKEQKILFSELQKTTDKESCKTLALKIKKLDKEIEDIEQKYTIIEDIEQEYMTIEDIFGVSTEGWDWDDTCIDDGYSAYAPFIKGYRDGYIDENIDEEYRV